MAYETQINTVRRHLRRSPLAGLEALNLYGIMRLASRINDLKKMGYDIKTEMIHGDNGKRYARYSLNHTQGELF